MSQHPRCCVILNYLIFNYLRTIFFTFQAQVGIPVRKYRIFMCMLPKEQRSYPFQVVVLTSATVQEFIGLICYKYASEHPDQSLQYAFIIIFKLNNFERPGLESRHSRKHLFSTEKSKFLKLN